jgi:cold-inducible RNA-binding protein
MHEKCIIDSKPAVKRHQPVGITIYIGNLSFERDEFGIKKLFYPYGYVVDVKIVRDLKTEKSKGYAFVTMSKKSEGLVAIKALNTSVVDERTLKVSEAKPQESKMAFEPKNKLALKPKAQKMDDEPKKKQIIKPKARQGLQVLFDFLHK